MYKAVFIDIDGTLIKSDHSLSDITIAAISKVRKNGVHVILVSARPLHGILSISDQLGLSEVPIASLNGSYITINQKVLYDRFIDISILTELYRDLEKFPVDIIYYQQMQWFAEGIGRYTINEQKITKVPLVIKSFHDLQEMWTNENDGPNKLLVTGEASVINGIQEKVSPKYFDKLNMYPSKPVYLEVMDCRASKNEAIKFFLNKFNFKREEVIAIGDNYNDKAMIEFAGLGIAMGNAPEEVKLAADMITDTNNEDGVAKVLEIIF